MLMIFGAVTILLAFIALTPIKSNESTKFLNFNHAVSTSQVKSSVQEIPSAQLASPSAKICYASKWNFASNSSLSKCIDGSAPTYYFRKGLPFILTQQKSFLNSDTSGQETLKWHIHFMGGGWCSDLKTCASRAKTIMGSSKSYPKCMQKNMFLGYLNETAFHNPILHGYQTVLVRYCDGGSFAGNADHVHNVVNHIID